MDKPIIFTPSELASITLAICGAIVSVSAAVAVIMKVWAHLHKPEDVQNERLAKAEKDIAEINATLKVYEGHLDRDKKRLDRIEFGNEVTQEALLALIGHALNGNDVDNLKKAKHKLEKYLISKGTRDEEE